MRRAGLVIVAALVLAGCNSQPPAAAPAKSVIARSPASTLPARAPRPDPNRRPTPAEIEAAIQEVADQRRDGTLANLATEGRKTEFDLPQIDEERLAAAGIHKLAGRHLELYTDMPPAGGLADLTAVFDAAVPAWCAYFGVAKDKTADWKLIACVMKDKDRFVRAGLYLDSLPDFPHGYNVGSQIWIYDQPSDYYRRHLLLHEGTHAFMLRWLGGAGPPWYMEGMAELLATHRWDRGQLELAIMPRGKDEVPYWGRVKIIKDEVAAGRPLSLLAIMHFDAHAHLKVEAYGWCWAAAAFLDAHPLTKQAFRELQTNVSDRTLEFSSRFRERLQRDWPAIVEDWQIFVAECDYGYDFERAAVLRKPAATLPPSGASAIVQSNRGWQSSGLKLEAGKTYVLKASGRYHLRSDPMSWPTEAGGVTIQYANGKPLGMLLAAVAGLGAEERAITPLASPQSVGYSAELMPQATGTLYFKINERAADLSDNTGTLTVEVQEKKRAPVSKTGAPE